MASDILPAKVVAHRPAPAVMVASAAEHDGCDTTGLLVDRALITLDGEWAEVSR